MKKLILLLLLIVIGCGDKITPPVLPSLAGSYTGDFVIEYGGFAPDTCRVYVLFDQIHYSVYYINISDCAFEGKYTLDGNCNLLDPTDECAHNEISITKFNTGAYELLLPHDSIYLTQTQADTTRKYFLKQQSLTE